MVYGNPFYISIGTPVAVIMLVNIIILTVVTISLNKNSKRRPMNNEALVISGARKAFAYNVLLGTTWVLEIFTVEKVTMPFSMVGLYNQLSAGIFYHCFLLCTKSRCEKCVDESAWGKSIVQDIRVKEEKRKTRD